MYPLVAKDAYRLAYQAHADQFYDHFGAPEPYICHLLRVALSFEGEVLQIIGLLHDIVEDTVVGVDVVRERFGNEVAEPVQVLTRRADEEYLTVYIPKVRANPKARLVKLADLSDNVAHCIGIPSRASQLRRYLDATHYLKELEHVR